MSEVMSHLHHQKKIQNRIRRLQGQMNAVHDAVTQEDVSCTAVLQQVAAIRGAVNGLMNELVEEHLKSHVLKADYDAEELKEFLDIFKKYSN
jgi:FrmR/RcnR family transcriptional regulator, repressor of rcnA expression